MASCSVCRDRAVPSTPSRARCCPAHAGALSLFGSACAYHVCMGTTGAVLLAVTLVPGTPSLRRGRLGDLAETLCLLALLPLVVLATGIYSSVR